MKVLLANKFFFIKGGAENSFFETAALLQKGGHDVAFFSMEHPRNLPSEYGRYFISNVDYEKGGFFYQLDVASKLLYSFEARQKMDRLIQDARPDLVHLNNIYHQISPSILHAIKKYKLPVVMSLRDYKVVCASYSMFTGGEPCEACKGGRYYQCFLKACVKRSRPKSLLSTMEMYLHHNLLDIYRLVDVFISPSRFLKDKIVEMGFKGKIVHIPNCLDSKAFLPRFDSSRRSICYLGRVDRTKGIGGLINAVEGLDVELRIIGEGPGKSVLESYIKAMNMRNVVFVPFKTGEALQDEIRNSLFTVIPSEWYENNPRSVLESMALGKAVVGARIGGIPELIRDGETGYNFAPGDAEDLREKIIYMLRDMKSIESMGHKARRMVEEEYSREKHYQALIEAYAEAVKANKARAIF